jgi:glutamate-ammonia-ligase adenylyltransferase
MALVKLRPAAGDPALGRRLLEARDAFVYSGRPVDLENLLHLRKRQAAELVRPGEIHAKYGPGGLVDVEYFVQARQIESGARDPSVRVPGTLEAVERLARGGHLPGAAAAELATAYLFLRRLIDALRVVRGHAEDSAIPARDSQEFAYLVRRLGYASSAALEAEIRQRMSFARDLWSSLT